MVHDCCTIIPKANLRELENYKFHPSSATRLDGLLDKFLWTPIVNVTPKNVSPNALTLLGGLCMLLANVIFFTKLPGLDSTKTPNHYRLVVALLILLYIIFDGIDGKQARRLGLSSALGQLMDHGVDASIVSTYTFVILLIFPGNYFCMVLTLSTLTLFGLYLIIWRESDLNVFSYSFAGIGVSEMHLLTIAALLVSYFYNGVFKRAVFSFGNSQYKLLRKFGLAAFVPQNLYPIHVLFGFVFVLYLVAFPCIVAPLYKKTKHKGRFVAFFTSAALHTFVPAYLASQVPVKDRVVATLFFAALGNAFAVHNIVCILGKMNLRYALKGLALQYVFVLARLYDLFVRKFKLSLPKLWTTPGSLSGCYLPLLLLTYLYLVLLAAKVIHEITNHLKIPFLFLEARNAPAKASARPSPKIFSGRKHSN